MIKVIGNRSILEIILIFTIVLIVGTFIATEAIRTSSVSILYSTLQDPRFTTFSYFLDATLVLIVSLIFLRRHKHYSNTLLFDALEYIVTSFTSFFVFLIIFATAMPSSVTSGWIYVYSASLALALVLLKDEHHRLRDFTTMVSSVGVGLVLGLNFTFPYAMIVLAAVAVYDYVGVFKSSEMVTLAKAVSCSDISFLVSASDLECVPEKGLSQKEIDSYINYLMSTRELDNPRYRRILGSGRLPVESQVSLGEGDLGLPLMVAISAFASLGTLLGIVAMLGAMAGIIVTMAILKVYKHPIPAIPPLFSVLGIFTGVALLITNPVNFFQFGALLLVASSLVMLIDIHTISRRMHCRAK